MRAWYMGKPDIAEAKDFSEFISGIETAWGGFEEIVDFLGECVQPKLTVELGSYKGYSSILLGGITDGNTYAIDRWDDFTIYEQAKANIDRARQEFHIDNVHPVRMDFTKYYRSKPWNGYIDILHIDGDHSYESVRQDFNTWSGDLAPEGVILLHDVANPAFVGPKSVLREESKNFNALLYPEGLGLGILTWDLRTYNALRNQFPNIREVNGES